MDRYVIGFPGGRMLEGFQMGVGSWKCQDKIVVGRVVFNPITWGQMV